MTRTRPAGLVLTFAVAAVTSLALSSSGAMATAPADVVPLREAALPARLHEMVVDVAARERVPIETVVAVVPSASTAANAGVFVGSDAAGADVIAPYNADGMMGFASVDRVSDYGGVMVFPSAAGEGGEVRRVSLVGVAEPRVAAVTIELADDSTLHAELVTAGRRGSKFFAYVTNSSSRFPVSYRSYGAAGQEIKSEDISQALTPPAGGVR